MQIINFDPHHSQEEGLVHVLTLDGWFMSIEDKGEWAMVSNKKYKGKAKARPCNVMSSSLNEDDSNLAPMTDTEEKNIVLTVQMLVARWILRLWDLRQMRTRA